MPRRKYAKDERLTPEQQELAAELYQTALAMMHKTFAGFHPRFREEFEAPTAVACCLVAARWRPGGGGSQKTLLFAYVRGYCLGYFNRHAKRAWAKMKTGTIGSPDRKSRKGDRGPWLEPPAPPAVARDDTLDPYLRFLDPRARRILEMRYCLGLTLEECGAALGGITKERVRQLEVKALKKLRAEVDRTPNVGSREIAVLSWTGAEGIG